MHLPCRLLALAALVCLMPVAAASQALPPAAPDPVAISRTWEDVLLLDAVRHLQMSPQQLQRTLPLAGMAEKRMAQLTERNRRTTDRLTRILDKHRAMLTRGERTSTVEQEQALLLRKALRDEQVKLADELVLFLTPRFAKILQMEQASRAFQLARGEWPEGVAKSPSLLREDSGFVLGGSERQTWERAAMERAMMGRYPVQSGPIIFGRLASVSDVSIDSFLVPSNRSRPTPLPPGEREARLAAARAEREVLSKDPHRLAALWANTAEPESLAAVSKRLAERLLLSPRFASALRQRAGAGGDPVEGIEDRWEDTLILLAVRYLQLTEDQRSRILSLAEAAAQRLAQLEVRTAPGNRALFDGARRFHEQLLHGRPVATAEQARLLAVDRTLRDHRAEGRAKLTAELGPRLAEILDRDQMRRVYLLMVGVWPRDEAKSPILLATESGFVFEEGERPGWRDHAIRDVLARTHPRDVAEEAMGLRVLFDAVVDPAERTSLEFAVELSFSLTDLKQPAFGSALKIPAGSPQQAAAHAELERLRERWQSLAALLQSRGASQSEFEVSLKPMVRRLFLSPRFRPVLEERARFREAPQDERASAPAVPPAGMDQ
jgi:hypothetical protein